MIPPFVTETFTKLNVELSPAQLGQLEKYLDLLLDANARVNLTAVKDRDAAWHRLILDSLTLLPGLEPLPAKASIVDVGTGGGLPGLPLAIARPDLRFLLVDATGKKVKLVSEFILAIGLTNASAVQARAEELGHDPHHRQKHDAAVSRAVGSVAEVLEYTLPLVKQDGKVLIIKGTTADDEIQSASDALATLGGGDVALFDGYPEEAGIESELVIISVIKERPTPRQYPRKPGIPRQSPL